MKSGIATTVLYEDADFIAADKPAQVLSHPNPGRTNERCAFAGRYDMRERRFDLAGASLWLIHRLDKDTSGVLLAAKTPGSAAAVRALFDGQEVAKTYLALVSGLPRLAEGVWKDCIETRRQTGQVRSGVRPGKRPNAELEYRVRERFEHLGLALLEIDLGTGKTHQIRVQAAHRGHPVLGDRIYGDFGLNRQVRRSLGLDRLFLHAASLEFRHPGIGKMLRIVSPLPEELGSVLVKARGA
jgi:RluA family pseudouridine synthase